jgi:hypothetical protein
MSASATTTYTTRRLAAAIAGVVVFDALWVRAPFLVIMALPFAVVAWRYRGRTTAAEIALFAFCALYAVIGVMFILANGLHAPAEPNEAREVISAGDFVFAYVGTPLSIWLGGRATRSIRARHIGIAPAAV